MLWTKIFLLSALLTAPALRASDESEDAFSCENAGAALEEVQLQQMTLKSEDSFKTLLELEEAFDQERAHLILLKGMQKLNTEYQNSRILLKQKGVTQPHSPKELLQLSGDLLKHQHNVHQVDVAEQILRTLSSDAPGTQGAIKKILSKNEDITEKDVSNIFQKHCQESDVQNDCRWYQDGDGEREAPNFVPNMTYLLAKAADKVKTSVNCEELNRNDCTNAKWEKFQSNLHTYQEILMENIESSALKSYFADDEWEKLEDSRKQLSQCTENCQPKVQQLNLAVVAYRDKVRRLEGGSDKAWESLKEFNVAADRIRTDQWKGAKVNQNRIDQFVRTRNPEIKLNNVEKAKAQMQIAQKEIIDVLSGDSYNQLRDKEKLRRKFAEETHVQLENFFSNNNVDERIQRFNPILQDLTGAEKNFLSKNNRDEIVLNAELFFQHIDKINPGEREDLKLTMEKEVRMSQNRLRALSRDMDSIKNSEAYKQGERLKRYVFERSRKNNCKYAGDTVNISCNTYPNIDDKRTLTDLQNNFAEILAVVDTSQPAEPVKAFRDTCKSSDRYQSACILVNRQFRRRYPAGTIADVIRESKKHTIIYNDRGRRVDYIIHDRTPAEIWFDGFAGALKQPQTMSSLHMLLTNSFYDDHLASYVDWAQQQKTWYHQSEQYQEYAEKRWVEDMFQSFHLNYAPQAEPAGI